MWLEELKKLRFGKAVEKAGIIPSFYWFIQMCASLPFLQLIISHTLYIIIKRSINHVERNLSVKNLINMFWVNMSIITKYRLTNAQEMMPYLPTDLGMRSGGAIHQLGGLAQLPGLSNWSSCFYSSLPALSTLLQQSQDPNLILPTYFRAFAHAVLPLFPCSEHLLPTYAQTILLVLQVNTLLDQLSFQTCSIIRWESKFFQHLSGFQKLPSDSKFWELCR